MKVLITQSNYIPWKGYFDAIRMVDLVVFYDDALYTKNDWRNRNLIKTKEGLKWLTIPVETSGRITNKRKINETKCINARWKVKHWNTIYNNYVHAKYFDYYSENFKLLYTSCIENYLSEINKYFIMAICDILGIVTKIRDSSEFSLHGGQTTKLVNICKELNATDYYTGPAARNYLNEDEFIKNNINVHYFDYSNYPEYPQLFTPFRHDVTIMDLLFNTGPNFKNYLKNSL